MTHYTYKRGGLYDQDGKQLLVLVQSNCSQRFRDEAERLLAAQLNDKLAALIGEITKDEAAK